MVHGRGRHKQLLRVQTSSMNKRQTVSFNPSDSDSDSDSTPSIFHLLNDIFQF